MNDKDFDKFFSDNLNEGTSFEPNERAWESLADRLDAHDEERKRGVAAGWFGGKLPYFLLPLCLLGLVGLSWLFFSHRNKADQNNALLNELHEVKNMLSRKDTVIVERVIYKRDTVIKFMYRPAEAPNEMRVKSSSKIYPLELSKVEFNSKDLTPQFVRIQNLISSKDFIISENTLDLSSAAPDEPFITKKEPLEGIQTFENQSVAPNNPASSVSNATEREVMGSAIPPALSAAFAQKDEKNATQITPAQVGTTSRARFLVGAQAGANWYGTAQSTAQNVSPQLGLRLEMALNERWRVMLSGYFNQVKIETPTLDDRYNLPAMPAAYDNADYTMQSVNAQQPLWQAFVGAKYVMGKKRVRPFVGINYGMMRIGTHDAHYHVQHNASGNREVGSSNHPGVTVYNLMQATGGVEVKISRRFDFQTEFFYNKNIERKEKTFDNFGIRAGLFFRFNQ